MISVIGLDLSPTSTGIAWATGCTSVKSHGHEGATVSDWAYRLRGQADRILAEIEYLDPRLIIVERPAWAAKQRYSHEAAGLYWLVLTGLKASGYTVFQVSPSGLKTFACGNGKAKKPEIVRAMRRQFKTHCITDDDQADALALAAAGHQWIQDPIGDIPPDQRAKLGIPPWEKILGQKKPKNRKPREKKKT